MYIRLHGNIVYGGSLVLVFPLVLFLYVDIYLLFVMLVENGLYLIYQHNISANYLPFNVFLFEVRVN